MAMRNRRRLLRALVGYGFDVLAEAWRGLGRFSRRHGLLLAALLCFLAGFAVALFWPRPPLLPGPTAEAPAPAAALPDKPPAPSPVPAEGTSVPAVPVAERAAGAPRRAAEPAPPRSAADFAPPLDGLLTAAYGWRRDPVFGDFRFHPGVDLTGKPGEAVTAAYAGKVVSVRQADSDYGREPAGCEVDLDHSGGWMTRYRFTGRTLVREGQEVSARRAIGLLGTPAALHFAIYRDGQAEQPPAHLAPPR